jgi:hypothetical protein
MQIDAVEKPADASPTPRRSRAGKYARKTRLITAEALDGRTRARRLYNQLISGIEADLGGRDQLSTIELALVQAFAGVSIHTANLNAHLLRGDSIDLTEHAAAVGAMVRIATRLGLQRRPRDVTPLPGNYLADLARANSPSSLVEDGDEEQIEDREAGP